MKRKSNPDQLELFVWANSKPSNVIDASEALWRKAAMEVIYPPRRPAEAGKVIVLERTAA